MPMPKPPNVWLVNRSVLLVDIIEEKKVMLFVAEEEPFSSAPFLQEFKKGRVKRGSAIRNL
mgnify:CR=1 FL=1